MLRAAFCADILLCRPPPPRAWDMASRRFVTLQIAADFAISCRRFQMLAMRRTPSIFSLLIGYADALLPGADAMAQCS